MNEIKKNNVFPFEKPIISLKQIDSFHDCFAIDGKEKILFQFQTTFFFFVFIIIIIILLSIKLNN